jgi:hypothetical protein
VHLKTDYQPNDRRFFCDDGQDAVRGVRWLVLRSDNYFVPGLFLVPRYDRELARLFPRRGTVFHHLGRYLFHPSNTVWAMVTRYRRSYLAAAGELVGLQVDDHYSQIISCVRRENILPAAAVDQIAVDKATTPPSSDHTERKAVLVVSLHGEYYDKLSSLYYEHDAAGGAAVSVFQPPGRAAHGGAAPQPEGLRGDGAAQLLGRNHHVGSINVRVRDENIAPIDMIQRIIQTHIYQVIFVQDYVIFYIIIGNRNTIHYSILCRTIEGIKIKGSVEASCEHAPASVQAKQKEYYICMVKAQRKAGPASREDWQRAIHLHHTC